MELILQGWIGRNSEGNLGLAEEINDYYESIAESIMDYFNCTKLNRGLGEKNHHDSKCESTLLVL